MQWFRMYAEFAHDPVVQSLAFEDQRHFVIALCLKSSGLLDREYPDPQARIAMLRRALGLDAAAFDEAGRRLMSSGLIDAGWQPVNWDKRQFVSDHNAADRKRRQRERDSHSHVTVKERDSHSHVTPSESDTEQNRTEAEGRTRARRACRLPEDFSPDLEFARSTIPGIDAEAEFARFRDFWHGKPGASGTKADWPATWRNWIRTCKDSGKYAKAGAGGVRWQ